jgi:diguanylate cyclase (GGDEF)-like protein/PAS domain S-box-containing protein
VASAPRGTDDTRLGDREDILTGLRASGQLAWSVLASLPGTSVLVLDHDLRIVLATGGAIADQGYTSTQMEGRLIGELARPGTLTRVQPAYEAALRGERPRFEHATGDPARIYDMSFVPVEHDGQIAGCMSIAREITQRKQAERAMARIAADYRELAEHVSDVIARTDRDAVYTYVSPASLRILGWSPDEMTGRSAYDFLDPADHEAHRALRERIAAAGADIVFEHRALRADGSRVWVEARSRALRDDDGQFAGIQTSVRDISDRKAAEAERAAADERFRTAFAHAPVGIALLGLDGQWLQVNDAVCAMVGLTREEFMGRTLDELTHPDDLRSDRELLTELLAGERHSYETEKRYLHADGSVVWARLAVALVRDGEGAPQHLIAQLQDTTGQRRLEDELRRLTVRDHLTGLHNRRHLEERLEQRLAHLRRHGGEAALLFLDLDAFKAVNDTLGHAAGDRLLCDVADTLRARLRATDVVARIGGDEFAILLDAGDRAAAEHVAEDLRAQLERGGDGVRVSIGAALLDGSLDVDAALRRADAAMYAIKRSRR